MMHSVIYLDSWQTGWGTRAGIGDPSQATAAMDNKQTRNPSNEKLTSPYQDSPAGARHVPQPSSSLNPEYGRV